MLIALALLSMGAGADETSGPSAEVIELAGILDGATLRYLADAIEESAVLGRELAVVQINSPAVVADLEELRQTAYSTVCPHGRPVMLRLTRREIEKNFQRI